MPKVGLMSGLTLNVIILGGVSLLTDVSSEMVFALLPFFMTTVLGVQIAVVGLIEGAAEATSSLLKVFSGWLSDRAGRRKPFATLGYSISALIKPLFYFSTSAIQVFTIRTLDRVGKGIRTSPRDALIADSIDPEVRGKTYGFHRSMDTLGAVLGPLMAFLLFPIIGYRDVFLASIIPGGLAVLLLLVFVRERSKHVKTSKPFRFKVGFKSLSRSFKFFIFIVLLFSLSNFSYAFFLLRAYDLGISIPIAPLLYLLFNVSYAVFAFPIGVLADKVGKMPLLSFGYAMFGITCLGFALAYHSYYAVALFVAYGVSYAAFDTLQRAIVPDLVPTELRGTAFGALHATTGLAALPASLIAGSLWQLISPNAPFIFGASLSLISSALILMLKSKRTNLQNCHLQDS
ncbi:MAG: MFS transporter [Nitrososphaerales archaeon]|nr:MFS transporter [Nitrososphaerales archaeon]